MKNQSHSTEHGQAVVLLVLAMVALLGFTALAVDGSMVYSDRRYTQNAADAASLAGGGSVAQSFEANNVTYGTWQASPPNCQGNVLSAVNTALNAARARARDNGFTLDTDISDNHGVVGECGVQNITAGRVGGGRVTIFVDKFVDIKAVVTSQTETAFAHFVFGNDLKNTVTAVTRVRPRAPLAYGYAIVALNPAACSGNQNGAQLHGLGGSADLTVDGGGIWSNGCLDVDGNPHVTVNNGGVFYFFTANNNDLDDIAMTPSGTPTQLANNDANRIPASAYDLRPPDCSGHEVNSNWLVNYARENPTNKEIPAGLYCVTDHLRLNAHDEIRANTGVTLVLYSGMPINGGAIFQLTAPSSLDSGTEGIPGVAIYAPKSNTSTIEFNGNNNSHIRGSVIAPGASLVILGNSGTSIRGQFIGWNVEFGGDSGTTVVYQMNKLASLPAKLELHR